MGRASAWLPSLYALEETLKRRRDGMGTVMPSAAAYDADPDRDGGPKTDEGRVIHEGSKSETVRIRPPSLGCAVRRRPSR
jgi:hypothetical protein